MIEEIKAEDGKIIAIVIKSCFQKEGVNFLSKEDYSLQLGISNYKKDDNIKAHYHIRQEISINKLQEVLHIDSGRIIVNLYDVGNRIIKSVKLEAGDTIFLIDGGHGFKILEDTKIIEVKQGPYLGRDKDKIYI